MKRLVEGIVDFYIAKKLIESEWKELYINGFTLIFSEAINFAFILLVGGIVGQFMAGFTYLIIFCLLRGFTGGFHAKKHWVCRIVTIGSFILTLILKTLFQTKIPNVLSMFVLFLVAGISFVIISKLAPVPHPNKPMSEEKKLINKRRAQVFAFIFLISSTIGILLNYPLAYISFLTVVAVAVLMVIGKDNKKINY